MRMKNAQRKSVNLSLDAEVVQGARTLGLNLSRIAEGAIRTAVAEETARSWAAEHETAIEAYNRDLERQGTFGAGLPGWWNAGNGPV
jgi:antitoxin CcdA